jgi:hypothetical protein
LEDEAEAEGGAGIGTEAGVFSREDIVVFELLEGPAIYNSLRECDKLVLVPVFFQNKVSVTSIAGTVIYLSFNLRSWMPEDDRVRVNERFITRGGKKERRIRTHRVVSPKDHVYLVFVLHQRDRRRTKTERGPKMKDTNTASKIVNLITVAT